MTPRVWTDTDDAAWRASPRHLAVCPDNSPEGEARELSRQPARNGRCGVVICYRHRDQSGRRKLVWKPCRTRSCPHCGPWLRREKLRRWQSEMDGWPVFLAIIADDRWPTLQRRLNRAKAQHKRIPHNHYKTHILSTIPMAGGVAITDQAATLAELLERQPLDRRRATSSAGWSMASATHGHGGGHDQDQGKAEAEWIPEGLVTVGLERALERARDLAVYVGPVTTTTDRGEAHLLQFPDDREVWRRWKRWAGLVQDLPGPRRRRPAADRLAS